MLRLAPLALGSLMTFSILAPQARAQSDKHIEKPDVVIEVGGLACPFCAYGIEKRLKKVEGIEQISVLLEEGKVELRLAEGSRISEERVRQAVKDAGFEAKSIVFANPSARALTPTDTPPLR